MDDEGAYVNSTLPNGVPAPRQLSADAAAALVPEEATVAVTGSGGGLLEANAIFEAVRRRFDQSQTPQGLTLVHSLGIGHPTGRGLELWAEPGLVRRVIGGHWTWSPTFQRLVVDDRIQAYAWPAGVISQLLREIGARRPGLITRTGLETFVDPRLGGGRCTPSTVDDLVSVIEMGGCEYLHYQPLAIDVGVIRGSYVDPKGNLSCADEPAQLDVLAVAQAAKASGGIVIAQAREQVEPEMFDPRLVHVPACLIDAIVLEPDQWQTYESVHTPEYSGARIAHEPATVEPADAGPLERRIIAGRAAAEVHGGERINVGFGTASGVVDVLARGGRLGDVEWLIEQGAIGGQPVGGDLFGISRGFDALLPSTTQFDLFSGGVLDRCFLSLAEVDAMGSVNVSLLGDRLIGPGGFIDISQNAAAAVFCGTFRARGLRVSAQGDRLSIDQEGEITKFVKEVQQVTYSGPLARRENRPAVFVTERCVFAARDEGLELVQVVAGVEIDRDIRRLMEFEPIVNNPEFVPLSRYASMD